MCDSKNIKIYQITRSYRIVSSLGINQIKFVFQHDMAYGELQHLVRGTTSDRILRDKTFNIAKNPKYARNQRGLLPMV